MTGDQMISPIRVRIQRQLEGHPFCRGLEPVDITALADRATLVEFASREGVFKAGDPADTFYLIRSGVVELAVDSHTGFPKVIQHISEGSVLGWSWLFEPYVWKFDAVTSTPMRGIAIDAQSLREHFTTDPESGYRVMARVAAVMAERLDATRLKLLQR